MKDSEAKLDLDNNKVICQECGQEIDNITVFTKNALKDVGQVIKRTKREPFQAYCSTCRELSSLYIKSKKAFCKVCNKQVVVNNIFLNSLEQWIEQRERDAKIEVEPEVKKPIEKKKSVKKTSSKKKAKK